VAAGPSAARHRGVHGGEKSRHEEISRQGNSRAFVEEVMVIDKERPINGVEPQKSEDDIQREQLGPRGVPGAPDPAKMTPQRAKKTPKHIDPGHTT
jgi:hypothetical protein